MKLIKMIFLWSLFHCNNSVSLLYSLPHLNPNVSSVNIKLLVFYTHTTLPFILFDLVRVKKKCFVFENFILNCIESNLSLQNRMYSGRFDIVYIVLDDEKQIMNRLIYLLFHIYPHSLYTNLKHVATALTYVQRSHILLKRDLYGFGVVLNQI